MQFSMDGRKSLILLCAGLFLGASPVRAAVVEVSAMYAYSKSEFEDYKGVQRRYTGSVEFKFTQVSSIQLEYTNSSSEYRTQTDIGTNMVYLTPLVTTYNDKIYSVNWVQNLVPAKWIVQPYLVLGGGKVARKVTQTRPELGKSQTDTQNSTTGTAGAGLRIFLLQNMALKTEFKSYVPDFRFSRWKENQMLSVGLSWLF
jgi:opacity protein-like surface antigen